MDMMDKPQHIRVNCKKIAILITILKAFFCQAYFLNFLSSQNIGLTFSLVKRAFLSIYENIFRPLA